MPARQVFSGAILLALGILLSGAGMPPRLAIPPGPLAAAIEALARATGVDIGGVDPALAHLTTRGLTGRMGADEALRRLLAPTPLMADRVAPGVYRLVRRPVVSPPRIVASRPVSVRVVAPLDGTLQGDIIVTGGKRDVPLSLYPGSATVIVPGDGAAGPHGAGGEEYLLRRTPILQATQLGPGRDKLFIRGIADSSFTGPTQATAGTYFGEVRTGYSGPDPNLNLFDMARVEVLEGPQGALYGAGSIGGVIRLVPNAVALDATRATVDSGLSTTAHGAIGYDVAAMLNLVPVTDRVGLRLVAYRSLDGGYIDDLRRGLADVNRQTETGGRATLRIEPIEGWAIEAGAVIQESRQPDLQYALIEDAPLTRTSAIAQPFEDDYKLGRLVITKDWANGLRLISATGRVAHDIDQRYDATRPPRLTNPLAYDEHEDIRLTTQEVRLSRALIGGDSWLIGAAYVHDTAAKARQFGAVNSQRDLIGVTNRTEEASVFASATRHLAPDLILTAGARYTHARMDGDPSTTTRTAYIRGRSSARVDPQFGLAYLLSPRITLFGQYQQGFRTGGLAVAAGVGRVANFDDDRIYVGEGGVRLTRRGRTGLAGTAAISYARWSDIQADLVSMAGFPYTANVGDGRILALEASIDWVPVPALQLTGGIVLDHSRLVDPAPDFAASGERPLPDTPPVTATGAVAWSRGFSFGGLRLQASLRYVGRSRLGVGPVLDLPYGNYLDTGAAATVTRGRVAFTLSADNLLDARRNRFAIGNPFGVALRDEVTPLRPRTLRLGARAFF